MFTKQMFDSFNELDFGIYNTVIRLEDKIERMRIKDLAEEAHVSTASVVRFCKKCGCKGYAEFRLQFRQSLIKEVPTTATDENQTVRDFLSYSTTEHFRQSMDSAFSYLQAATQILVIGLGASGNLASFGSRVFCNVDYFSLYINDPFLHISNMITTNPVVVAVSFSGETEQTITMAREFQENGCKLISITNTSECPLAKMADVNIAYYVPDVPINGKYNLGTEIPVVYIFESLARRLYEYRQSQK